MKDQNRFFTYFIVVLSIVVLSIGGYFAVQAARNIDSSSKSQIDKKNDYPLRRNATEYQKEIHKELMTAIGKKPLDKNTVSELVAKNFVADYFTWTNKLQFNDVGGLQYIHKDYRKSVYDKSLDTFYNDLRFYLEEGSAEESLEVSNIKTKVSRIEIEMDEKDIPAYLVETNWSYQESNFLDVDEYQTKTFIKVVENDEGHFSVVEVNGNEEKED